MITNNVLTAKHTEYGLYLEEYSDHVLFLKSPLTIVATFMQSSVNPDQIRKAADKYLLEIDAQ